MNLHNNYVNEIALSYTPTQQRRVKIKGSRSAHRVLRKLWDQSLINIQEQFYVLLLNNANEVVGFRCIATGTITSCQLDMKILFGLACKSLSCAIIVAHNHPSGKTQVSKEDIITTRRIEHAAALLDIRLLDHIIITPSSYISLADLGITNIKKQ